MKNEEIEKRKMYKQIETIVEKTFDHYYIEILKKKKNVSVLVDCEFVKGCRAASNTLRDELIIKLRKFKARNNL